MCPSREGRLRERMRRPSGGDQRPRTRCGRKATIWWPTATKFDTLAFFFFFLKLPSFMLLCVDFSPLFWFMHVMSCLCLCPLASLSRPLHMCVCSRARSRVCACSHVFVIYALVEGLRGEERRVNLSRLSLWGFEGALSAIFH